MLKKEFNRKDVDRMRNLIAGKANSSSETQVGYNKKRNNAAKYYTDNLKSINGIETPINTPKSEKHSWHLYVIKIKNSFGVIFDDIVAGIYSSVCLIVINEII